MIYEKSGKYSKAGPPSEVRVVHLKGAFGFDEVPPFEPFLMSGDFRGNQKNE